VLVIEGSTPEGDVIADDPAAADDRYGEIIYDRKQFAKAWLKTKLGTAYIIARSVSQLAAVKTPVSELFSSPLKTLSREEHDRLIESQLLFNERAEILATNGSWVKIRAPEQPERPKCGGSLAPYEGWIKSETVGFQIPEHGVSTVSMKEITEDGMKLSIGTRLPYAVRGKTELMTSASRGAALRRKIISKAMLFINDRYYWGGRSAWGVDCSGLINLAYRSCGIDLPRNAAAQLTAAERVKKKQLKTADLIFSSEKNRPDCVSHVMIYAGSGRIIEATRDSNDVRIVTFSKKFGIPFSDAEDGLLLPDGRTIFLGTVLGNGSK